MSGISERLSRAQGPLDPRRPAGIRLSAPRQGWKPPLFLLAVLLGLSFVAVQVFNDLLPEHLRVPLALTAALLLVVLFWTLWLLRQDQLVQAFRWLLLILMLASSVTVLLLTVLGPAELLSTAAVSFLIPITLTSFGRDRRMLHLVTSVSLAVTLFALVFPLLQRAELLPAELTQRLGVMQLAVVLLFLIAVTLIMNYLSFSLHTSLNRVAEQRQVETLLNERLAQNTRERAAADDAIKHALERERSGRARLQNMNRQQAFLADLGLLLSAQLDLRDGWKTRLPRLLVPRLGSWAALDLLNDESVLLRVAEARHTEAGLVQLDFPGEPVPHDALRALTPGSLPSAPQDAWSAGQQGAVIRSLPREHPLHPAGRSSEILIPLQAHGVTLGLLTLISEGDPAAFSSEEQRVLTDIGRQAALAIQNSQLYNAAVELSGELERRVQLRTSQLERANAELEAFTYSASHDLREPLRGIDGFSQALLEDYGDVLDETARGYLERIRRAAWRMGTLIDALLSLSSLSQGRLQPGPVDLGTLVQQLFSELQEAEPERNVRLLLEGDLQATADPRLVSILLQNLLGNSWKFSAPCKQAEIKIGSFRKDSEKVFFVQDNGVGFDMAYAVKLFTPFQRLHGKSEFEGNGIGLATVERIASRHGGRAWATGAVGEGATFFFTLPGRRLEGAE